MPFLCQSPHLLFSLSAVFIPRLFSLFFLPTYLSWTGFSFCCRCRAHLSLLCPCVWRDPGGEAVGCLLIRAPPGWWSELPDVFKHTLMTSLMPFVSPVRLCLSVECHISGESQKLFYFDRALTDNAHPCYVPPLTITLIGIRVIRLEDKMLTNVNVNQQWIRTDGDNMVTYLLFFLNYIPVFLFCKAHNYKISKCNFCLQKNNNTFLLKEKSSGSSAKCDAFP